MDVSLAIAATFVTHKLGRQAVVAWASNFSYAV